MLRSSKIKILKRSKIHLNLFTCINSSIDSGSRTPRRKSFYNFFLRHQDAVDDSLTSPSVGRKLIPLNCSAQTLNLTDEKQPLPKTKRATSFVRKKPPLERGLSAQSALRINKNALVGKLLLSKP